MSIKNSNVVGLNMLQKGAVATSDIQWEMVKLHGWQCCFNCEHFIIDKAVCVLNDRRTPPPQVILLGCKDHICDIPF